MAAIPGSCCQATLFASRALDAALRSRTFPGWSCCCSTAGAGARHAHFFRDTQNTLTQSGIGGQKRDPGGHGSSFGFVRFAATAAGTSTGSRRDRAVKSTRQTSQPPGTARKTRNAPHDSANVSYFSTNKNKKASASGFTPWCDKSRTGEYLPLANRTAIAAPRAVRNLSQSKLDNIFKILRYIDQVIRASGPENGLSEYLLLFGAWRRRRSAQGRARALFQ